MHFTRKMCPICIFLPSKSLVIKINRHRYLIGATVFFFPLLLPPLLLRIRTLQRLFMKGAEKCLTLRFQLWSYTEMKTPTRSSFNIWVLNFSHDSVAVPAMGIWPWEMMRTQHVHCILKVKRFEWDSLPESFSVVLQEEKQPGRQCLLWTNVPTLIGHFPGTEQQNIKNGNMQFSFPLYYFSS